MQDQDVKILECIFHFNEGFYYFRNIHNRVLLGGGRQLDKKGETTTKFENSSLQRTLAILIHKITVE